MVSGTKLRVGAGAASTVGHWGGLSISRAMRVASGPESVVGHFGGLSITPAIRRSVESFCYDLFDRTVATGWGGGTFLSGWSPAEGYSDARTSVDGSHGVIDIAKVGVSDDIPMGVSWPSGTPTYVDGGEVWAKFRWQGTTTGGATDGEFGFPCQLMTGTTWTWGTGAVGGEVSRFRFSGTDYLRINVDDARPAPSGFWSNGYLWVPVTLADVRDNWWNLRLRVDQWGVYAQLWMDGEAQDAHPAPYQPWDAGDFGSGWANPNRETWTAWEAWDTAFDPVTPTTLFMGGWTVNRAASAYLQFESITTTGGLCTA